MVWFNFKMNNYFTKYIPNIRLSNTVDSDDHTIGNSTNSLPHINYIIIFNPTFVSPKAESDEELIKQIIVFLQGKDLPESQFSQIEQLKLIGLLRGIESLVKVFPIQPRPQQQVKNQQFLNHWFLNCNDRIGNPTIF